MNEKIKKFLSVTWNPKPNQIVKYLERQYFIKTVYKNRIEIDNIWVEKTEVEPDINCLFEMLFKIGFKTVINCSNTFEVTLIHPNNRYLTVKQDESLYKAILAALIDFVEKYQSFCDLTQLFKKEHE